MTTAAVLDAWLAAAGLAAVPGRREGERVVRLPGTSRREVPVSVIAGTRSLSVSAFVLRRPEQDEAAVHAWLLRRSLRLPGVAFALDDAGDVFLVGRLPAAGLTPESVDELMGAVLSACDGSFDTLIAMGYAEAVRREWRWRRDRGEPLDNLRAFRHLTGD